MCACKCVHACDGVNNFMCVGVYTSVRMCERAFLCLHMFVIIYVHLNACLCVD